MNIFCCFLGGSPCGSPTRFHFGATEEYCFLWTLYKHLINMLGFLAGFEINSCLGATQLWLVCRSLHSSFFELHEFAWWYLGPSMLTSVISMERWNAICYIIPCQFSNLGNLTGAAPGRTRMRGGNHGWDCEIPVCWRIFFQYCCVYCGRMILQHGSASSAELFGIALTENWTSASGKCCFYSWWQDCFFFQICSKCTFDVSRAPEG